MEGNDEGPWTVGIALSNENDEISRKTKFPINRFKDNVNFCNSRLFQSHMRLKKNRPYNHCLKSQEHYLLCFSTSNGRSQFGTLAT